MARNDYASTSDSALAGFFVSSNGPALKATGATGKADVLFGKAGTAAAPSLAFDTDPNTGFYSIGADQLGIATGARFVLRSQPRPSRRHL